MTTMYRRARMKYGIRWHTGQPFDWTLFRECLYLFAVIAMSLWIIHMITSDAIAQDEVTRLQSVVDARKPVQCNEGRAKQLMLKLIRRKG